MEYVLEMKDISKTFPGVVALDHVQLQVRPGEVHALMGENGAGKSTLMKILMGIYTKDPGGEIFFDGKPYSASNPTEAMDMGVAMIHQELNPILDMAVYENIFVGREIRKNGLVDKKTEIEEAQKLIEECGRLQVPGRPHLYRTTKQFLRAFHLTSLDDLPEMPDLGGEGQMRLNEDGEIIDPAENAEINGADAPETAGFTETPE